MSADAVGDQISSWLYPFSEHWFDLLLLLAFLIAVAYCYYVLYRIGRTLGGGS